MPKPRSKRSPFLKDINRWEVDILYFVNPKGSCGLKKKIACYLIVKFTIT
jgi:hypothetical protein